MATQSLPQSERECTQCGGSGYKPEKRTRPDNSTEVALYLCSHELMQPVEAQMHEAASFFEGRQEWILNNYQGRGQWRIPSRSEPGHWHLVLVNSKKQHCSCKGYLHYHSKRGTPDFHIRVAKLAKKRSATCVGCLKRFLYSDLYEVIDSLSFFEGELVCLDCCGACDEVC